MKPKKISILTASGCKNLWDECILKQEILLLEKKYTNPHISIFTYDADETRSFLWENPRYSYISYFPNKIRKNPLKNCLYLLQNIRAFLESDLIIIGGGGIFYGDSDETAFKRLMKQWKWRVYMASFLKKPLFFWSISIEIKNPKNFQYLIPLFTGKKTTVTVRDNGSKKIIENLWCTAILVPDAVLTMDTPQEKPQKTKKVGFAIRWWCIKDEQKSIEAMITFVQSLWYEPIFFSHSFHEKSDENDALSMHEIAEKYHREQTKNIQETLSLYKELDFVIAWRLHAAILSTVHNIPHIILSYSRKTEEFAKLIEYDYILSSKDFNREVFEKRFLELIENSHTIKEHLLAIHHEKKQIIQETIEWLLP